MAQELCKGSKTKRSSTGLIIRTFPSIDLLDFSQLSLKAPGLTVPGKSSMLFWRMPSFIVTLLEEKTFEPSQMVESLEAGCYALLGL